LCNWLHKGGFLVFSCFVFAWFLLGSCFVLAFFLLFCFFLAFFAFFLLFLLFSCFFCFFLARRPGIDFLPPKPEISDQLQASLLLPLIPACKRCLFVGLVSLLLLSGLQLANFFRPGKAIWRCRPAG